MSQYRAKLLYSWRAKDIVSGVTTMGDECNPVGWRCYHPKCEGSHKIIIKGVIFMGYIYKIENKLNGKKYIGQTVKPLEKRFSQHQHNYTKPYFSQLVLYKAFNKYGIENFSFEEVEEVPNELLDEREKYWISYYNSYYDGYNSTIGGRATQLYEWDEDEVIEAYHQLKSARAVAREVGCDHNTIDRILNLAGVKRYSQAQQKTPGEVILEKDNQQYTFSSSAEAA